MKAIYFDMDGTIADFYGVPNWLDYLNRDDTYPYKAAKPLVNMSLLARLLNRLQAEGWHIGIVSWLSKTGTEEFNARTTAVKMAWLKQHLPSVHWDEYNFINYGVPKYTRVLYADGILFDDERQNRCAWTGTAYDVDNIIEILKSLN